MRCRKWGYKDELVFEKEETDDGDGKNKISFLNCEMQNEWQATRSRQRKV